MTNRLNNSITTGGGEDVNVLALVKGDEHYIFMFRDDKRREVLGRIGNFAANPDLNFTWYDAAVLSQKIRMTTV